MTADRTPDPMIVDEIQARKIVIIDENNVERIRLQVNDSGSAAILVLHDAVFNSPAQGPGFVPYVEITAGRDHETDAPHVEVTVADVLGTEELVVDTLNERPRTASAAGGDSDDFEVLEGRVRELEATLRRLRVRFSGAGHLLDTFESVV